MSKIKIFWGSDAAQITLIIIVFVISIIVSGQVSETNTMDFIFGYCPAPSGNECFYDPYSDTYQTYDPDYQIKPEINTELTAYENGR